MVNKDIWKKILEAMPDDDLILLASTCDIKVQGFRQITQKNINTIKPKLILEALKPKKLKFIINFFDTKADFDEEDEDKNYRNMSLEAIIKLFKEGTARYEILAALYSSSNKNHIAIADEFVKYYEEQNRQVSLFDLVEDKKSEVVDEEEDDNLNQQLDEMRKVIKKLEKKLEKSDQKNGELQLKIKDQEKKYSNAQLKWEKEKKKLLKKISDLQNEQTSQNNLVFEKDKIIKAMEKQNIDIENQLTEKNAQISHLNALILNSERASAKANEDGNALFSTEKDIETTSKKRVAIIGNPKNKSIKSNQNLYIETFESSNINTDIDSNVFRNFQEIWLLTYKVPSTKQKVVHDNIQKPVLEKNTFMQLRSMMEKGKIEQ